MNISSKLKKIISFVLVAALLTSAVVLPVSAEESTTEETEHQVAFDMSAYPEYKAADLEYTGDVSENVKESFNIRKEYDMRFTKNDYYICRPFTFDYWQTIPDDFSDSFSESWLWQKIKEGQGNVILPQELNLKDFDVYYIMTTGRNYFNDHNLAYMTYYLVPHGAYIAFSNDSSNNVGVYVKDSLLHKNNGGNVAHSVYRIERGAGDRAGSSYGALDVACDNHCFAWSNVQLVASNIPVFDYYSDAMSYLDSQPTLHDPHGKVPEDEPEEDYSTKKISADAFGWNSFDCSLVQDGNSYKFIYKYDLGSNDMKNNPSSYYFTCEYSQNVKYKVVGQTNDLYKSKSSTLSKDNYIDSGGTTINRFNEMGIKVYDGSDDGTSGSWFRFALYNLLGSDEIQGSANILSSYLYVTVTLHHTYVGTSSQSLSGVNKVLKDTSSDVRHFKYNALTGERVDASDVVSNVVTKDVTDEKGNTVKEVTQITTNDNSTHDTINNYYYDSNGNKSNSSTGSSVLSDILSELIQFIKTLVTEGLPAALEILKTLISSLTGIVSDALNNIDIGTGTTNGILAVFKALPPAMWSLLLIGIVVLVVVGIINRIF